MAKLIGLALAAALGTVLLGLALSFAATLIALVTLLRGGRVPISYNLRSLFARRRMTALTMFGMGVVVFLLTCTFMLQAGINRTLISTGRPQNAIVIRAGAQTESESLLRPEQLAALSVSPEIAVGADGKPNAVQQLAVFVYQQRPPARPGDPYQGGNVLARGVASRVMGLYPDVKLTEGRMFTGPSEVVIGKRLVGRFDGMRLGGTLHFAERDWRVVGILDAGGTAFDSELWGQLDDFQTAFHRPGSASSLLFEMKQPASLEAVRLMLKGDGRLAELDVQGEPAYYASQSEYSANFVGGLGLALVAIAGLGAIIGAMITMYNQVAIRRRELAVMRTLGFRRRAIYISVTIEAVSLSLLAGCLGVLAAAPLQAVSFTATNFVSFTEVAFSFVLTPAIVLKALIGAAVMGYASSVLPAWSACRSALIEALRG
jgi:ABC-type lipoprotein release transport system permease subunit